MTKEGIINIHGDNNSFIHSNEDRNLIIENSPVKFAIVTANEFNREVFIRSSDAGLDLIGSVSLENKDTKFNILDSSLLLNSFVSKELSYNIVRTTHKYYIDNKNRKSEYWFIWQGHATESEREVIKEEFENRIYDLNKSASFSYGSLEWNLAPIITLCNNITNNRINRLKRKRLLSTTFVSLYSILALVYFLKMI